MSFDCPRTCLAGSGGQDLGVGDVKTMSMSMSMSGPGPGPVPHATCHMESG